MDVFDVQKDVLIVLMGNVSNVFQGFILTSMRMRISFVRKNVNSLAIHVMRKMFVKNVFMDINLQIISVNLISVAILIVIIVLLEQFETTIQMSAKGVLTRIVQLVMI